MLASEVRALIAGLAVVSVAGVGALVWRQQHPNGPDVAQLVSLAPEKSEKPASKPITPKPAVAMPGAAPPVPSKPAQTARQEPAPKLTDLGIAPPAPRAPEPEAGKGEPPHFDVVRVEPSGEAVLAGKGDPNAKVELLASGKVVAESKADSSGHFVFMPSALIPGNYDLTLRQTTGGRPARESTQSVAVSVPAKGNSSQLVVAMAEPGKPTKLLSGSPAVSAAAPVPAAKPETVKPETAKPETAKPETAMTKPETDVAKPETVVAPPPAVKPAGPDLAIRSVELENGNGFFASGAALAGTHIQIYLNGTHLAEVVAGSDGQWSLTIKKGLTGGHYTVRADAGAEGHGVMARVEVPFDVPVTMAEAPRQPAPVSPAPGPEAPKAPQEAAHEAALKPPSPPVPAGPEPPSAPNPDEVAGLGLSAPAPAPSELPAPAPRPEIEAPAKAAAPVPPPPAASAPVKAAAVVPGAHAVIEQVATALVVPGDNLWNISRARLGFGKRFTEVYAANVSQIRDPKLIYPGQVFVVPPK